MRHQILSVLLLLLPLAVLGLKSFGKQNPAILVLKDGPMIQKIVLDPS
jgi:hypothetical protein